jgi:hypothetical protein
MLIQKTRVKKIQAKRQNRQIANRFNVPIACLAGLFIVSIGTMFQITLSLYGMILVIIFLLASASQNAWALLVQIEDKNNFIQRNRFKPLKIDKHPPDHTIHSDSERLPQRRGSHMFSKAMM